ncbi:sulfur carrier protein ThiS [Echinicola jeungdonensis]|uniref:Sulfur carrier protein ThiS n=1 Tax=Echinicola jeungdonensis TaxID=709343 RepID=A0ABV5J7X1_9BACT|nr:sulfur carrier protein ThiS [Echinicola jeungdonensis]MDN3670866.1 sulfur carrier protein ThiS [Echinicola jeungdonensis]
MKFLLNGEPCNQSAEALTLSEMLVSNQIKDQRGIAIAVNQQVVPKIQWSDFQLNENDEVLIIKATQGG